MRLEMALGALLIVVALVGSACNGDDTGNEAPDADSGVAVRSVPCPDDRPELRRGLEAIGEDGLIRARVVDADAIPPRLRLNDWTVLFLNESGQPLLDAEITMAEPFMRVPGHLHNGIYPPRITKLEEPGTFLIADLNLWMYGPWDIDISVSSESVGDDFISIPTCNNY
jgi:hypothetical protein